MVAQLRLHVRHVFPDELRVVGLADAHAERAVDGSHVAVLEAFDSPRPDDGAGAFFHRNGQDEPARLRAFRDDGPVHLRSHPPVQLVVAEDCRQVLVELFLHEVPGLKKRNAAFAGDHEPPQRLLGNGRVSPEGDLLHLEVRPLLDEDANRVGVGRLRDRVLDFRAVVALRLKVAALGFDVLEDQVLVEHLPFEQDTKLGLQLLLFHPRRLEHDARAHGDPVDGHDAAVARGLRRDELDGRAEPVLLVEVVRQPRRVGAGVRLAVALSELELQPSPEGRRP